MCIRCGMKSAYPGIPNLCCKDCANCITCNRFYWVYADTLRCWNCQCGTCGVARAGDAHFYNDYSEFDQVYGRRPIMCGKCYAAKYPDPMCICCHKYTRTSVAATLQDRRPKIPNSCQ